MSNFINRREVEERNEQQQYMQAVEAGIQQIYSAYPKIKPCTASAKMILEICQNWVGGELSLTVVPSVELMKTILYENEDAFASLGLQSVKHQREDLIEEICALLASTHKPNDRGAVGGGKYSPADIKALVSSVLQWQSRDQLIEYRDSVILKQQMAKQTVSELKQVIEDSKPQRRKDGMPQLPEFMVLPGQVQATKIDADFLNKLIRVDYEMFKMKFVRPYGAAQVDERRGIR
jgi:hypothetical protein